MWDISLKGLASVVIWMWIWGNLTQFLRRPIVRFMAGILIGLVLLVQNHGAPLSHYEGLREQVQKTDYSNQRDEERRNLVGSGVSKRAVEEFDGATQRELVQWDLRVAAAVERGNRVVALSLVFPLTFFALGYGILLLLKRTTPEDALWRHVVQPIATVLTGDTLLSGGVEFWPLRGAMLLVFVAMTMRGGWVPQKKEPKAPADADHV